MSTPRRKLNKRLLGTSWGALEVLLGALGAVLEPSWAPLGTLLCDLGAILRPPKRIRNEMERMRTFSKTITQDTYIAPISYTCCEGNMHAVSTPRNMRA